MKKCISVKLLVASLVISFIPFGLASPAPPAKKLVFKYGHVGPLDQQMHKSALFFKKYVEEKTGGTIEIQVYPLGQLGGERTIFDSILAGTADMGSIGAPIQATVIKEFNVLCLPFILLNEDVLWEIVRTKEFRGRFFTFIRGKGIEPVGFPNISERGILTKKRAVRKVEDMRGLNIRVMEGNIYTDTYKAMGAFPRTMPFPEVYTALQQGVIDTIDSGLDMAAKIKVIEVAKFYTNLYQTIQTNPLVMAKPSWDKLTSEQQEIFRNVNEQMELFSQEEYRKDKIETQKIAKEKYGVKIEDLTFAELETFRKAVEPVVAKYRKAISEDFVDFYIDLARKYEKKYKK